MFAIALVDTLFSAALLYVGYKFGARAVTKVRTELAHIEAEIGAGFSHTATSVLARIKKLI